jgi:LmbE family N-acetylglucosaminyl deacetylase
VSVVFDHRDAGTPESLWLSAIPDQLPVLPVPDRGRLVVVAAHPDDETLGAGGLIASAAAAGISITVLVGTGGEGSHPESPTLRPAQLAAIRRAEVFDAVGVLAPEAALRQLGLPDGRLADRVADLAAALSEVVDADTLIVTPWSGDGHPDHTAAADAGAQVAAATGARHWQYPIWLWHWGSPDDLAAQSWHRVELSTAALSAKLTAIARHRSQVSALSTLAGDESVLPPPVLAHFRRSFEVFLPDSATRTPAPLDFREFWAGAGDDPWGIRTRWYEERKRALLLAALPRRRFRSAFEPGCAHGDLTAALAPRCDALLAGDVSDIPLATARERLADSPQVQLRRLRVPEDWPAGAFDLIVLSEIGYYCSASEWRQVAGQARESLTPDGILVACHWRHPVPESASTGDDVHRVLRRETGLRVLVEHSEPDLRLTVLAGPDVPNPVKEKE